MMNLSIIDTAYIAGIIDGEGGFSIRHVKSNKGKAVNWFSYNLTVAMASKPVIEKCHSATGVGSVNQLKRKTSKGNPIWYWCVCGRPLVDLCHILLPYLIEKKAQAELIIELASTMNNYGDPRKPSPEVINYRVELKEQLQRLTL